MSVARIDVETQAAGRYSDIDQEGLHRLISQLGSKNSYLILHRADKPEEFAQVLLEPAKSKGSRQRFLVEFKDESEAQFQAKTTDMGQVQDVLAGWAFDIPGWKGDLKWRRLKLNKVVDLRGACEFSEDNGVWKATFPLLQLEATGHDEDSAFRELQTVIAETVNRSSKETRLKFSRFLSNHLIELSPEDLKQKLERERLSEEQQIRVAKSAGRWLPDEEDSNSPE